MSPHRSGDAGLWFRHANDVLGRVYSVCLTVRVIMAVHAIGTNLVVVMPTRSTSPCW